MTTATLTPSDLIPRICATGTAVCLGGGPSLTQADVDYCRGKATIIAINDAYKLAPWADALYACDAKWWQFYDGVPEFAGLKYALEGHARGPGVTVLPMGCQFGLRDGLIQHGKNGGYQAIQVAMHMGATRVLLLGYDMQKAPNGAEHWFGSHPPGVRKKDMAFQEWLDSFATIVEPLKAAGISVVNCSRRTALTVFPQMTIEEAL